MSGDDRSANASSNGNTDKYIGKGIGSTYGGQGILADETAYNHRICHGIKLLEQVADNHRHSKDSQGFGGFIVN